LHSTIQKLLEKGHQESVVQMSALSSASFMSPAKETIKNAKKSCHKKNVIVFLAHLVFLFWKGVLPWQCVRGGVGTAGR
jgi:hypothetical protein